MTEKKSLSLPSWLNSVLITVLIIVASASFFQNKQTQVSVDMLQIQTAIINEKITNHISWGEDQNKLTLENIDSNEKRIGALEKAKYVTQTEFLTRLDEFHKYVIQNYKRKD